jgi:hypothetical protein
MGRQRYTNRRRRTSESPRCIQADGGAATGAVEITLPVAIVAAAYIIGQGLVDTWGE